MAEPILPTLQGPAQLKQLSLAQLQQLAAEIRAHIIEVVTANGGHLGSNLGMVELTMALHRVFDSPKDKIIIDIGHQGYVHKILTGRAEHLRSLRQFGGCSGFLQREESEHDHFGAGHAGTGISAALGFAAARDRLGTKEKVVAIVGDAGLGCGLSLEALNNAAETTKDFILILNDNKMSISPNVGSFSKYLNRIITDKRYSSFKTHFGDFVKSIPAVGQRLSHGLSKLEEATKSLIVPGVIFEELGLRYLGPVDGHNLEELIKVLEHVHDEKRPVLLHVLTEKGRGFDQAKHDPEKCHGFKKQVPYKVSGCGVPPPPTRTFSEVFGEHLNVLAERDVRTVAVTAGMLSGTGMSAFRAKHPDKVYDTGIAEEHATIFAAGMAAGGLRPVVGIYATFMQRALDCVYHDVCIQELPVMFCLDRAGLVEDGPTHHGIFDLGFWRSMPNLMVLQPRDETEMRQMMDFAFNHKLASVIRYPKTDCTNLEYPLPPLELGRSQTLREGTDLAIWSSGRECVTALQVAALLQDRGLSVKVVNARFVKPLDEAAVRADAARMPIMSIEDHCVVGGLGTAIGEVLATSGGRLKACGYPPAIVTWGAPAKLREMHRMNTAQLADDALAFLGRT